MNTDPSQRFSMRELISRQTGYISPAPEKKQKRRYTRKLARSDAIPPGQAPENQEGDEKANPIPDTSEIPDHNPNQFVVCIGNRAYFNLK